MDTGRVGACHKLENKRRKFLIVINDVVKNKYDVYAEYLDHAHKETDHNFEKSKMFVRRALVRQKVLQKCMKMRRLNINDERTVFGRYGGKPIESFGKDIESFIAYNHPKMRRQRHLQKLLNESLEKGAILKQNVVENRVASWMERSYTKYKLMKAKREKTNLEPIKEKSEKSIVKKSRQPQLRLPVLTNPFYSGSKEVEAEMTTSVDADVLKITEDLEKVNIEKKENREGKTDGQKDEIRRTLVLPPINPSKAMVAT